MRNKSLIGIFMLSLIILFLYNSVGIAESDKEIILLLEEEIIIKNNGRIALFKIKISAIEVDIKEAEEIRRRAKEGQSQDNPYRQDNIRAEQKTIFAISTNKNTIKEFYKLVFRHESHLQKIKECIKKLRDSNENIRAGAFLYSGKVTLIRVVNGKKIKHPISNVNLIELNDEIKTGIGHVNLIQKDGVEVNLDNQTHYKFLDPEIDRYSGELKEGKIHFIKYHLKKTKEELKETIIENVPFKVKAQSVIVATRGTEFDLQVDEINLSILHRMME